MTALIKPALDQMCSHITFDAKLARRLNDWVIGFATRNPEHQKFFGGNLIGVHRPLFSDQDVTDICEGILNIDIFEVRKKLLSISFIDNKTGKSEQLINPKFKTASNELYQLMMYITHRFLTAKIKADVQSEGAIAAIMIFQIRAITSKLRYDFKYAANEEMALAVSMSLSKKFSIKNHGTWFEVLLNRARTVIDPKEGVHYKQIIAYSDDAKIINSITDTQGRMKDLVMTHWDVIREVMARDKKVLSQKSTISVDGETILRDLIRSKPEYLNYIQSVVLSEPDFIRDDLVERSSEFLISAKPDAVKKTLKTLVNMANEDYDGSIEKFVREVAIYAFDVLYQMYGSSTSRVDLPVMLVSLRGKLMASKGKEKELLYLRDEGDRITYLALKTTNKALLASVRTTVIIYIVLRMMLKGKI